VRGEWVFRWQDRRGRWRSRRRSLLPYLALVYWCGVTLGGGTVALATLT